jgi:recombinational DNA repair protein RecR
MIQEGRIPAAGVKPAGKMRSTAWPMTRTDTGPSGGPPRRSDIESAMTEVRICPACGLAGLQPAGSCTICLNCGSSHGCS